MKKMTDLGAASSKTLGIFVDQVDGFQTTCPATGLPGVYGSDPNSGPCG